MEYSKGQIKKVILARFDDGDILIDELKKLATKERINAGKLLRKVLA